jgi:hypothetical protein
MHFVVTQAVLGYNKTIQKQFVTGTPTNGNQVKIGPTNADTFDNLFSNLILNDTDSGVGFTNLSFSANPIGDIQMVFVLQETYVLNVITNTANRFEVLLSLVDDLAPIVYVPYDIKDLEIVIIDNEVNSLPLVVEFTEKNAPKLKYDSGDDLLSPMMTSKLDFNLLVTDGADAKFKHLFTSGENRFLTQLNAYDSNNVKQLLWQGFLLPDQYSEPYKGGAFFVPFTAIDMLASLKGKYFDRWYYENRLPIIEIIAGCLKATGLNQNILVNPSFKPKQNPNFEALNLDLKIYNDNEKLTDFYQILEDILIANCLTIVNFKGFWILTGFGEKRQIVSNYKQFDTNGQFVSDYTFAKIVRQNIYSNGSVNLSLKTPYKRVEVNSNFDGNKNMYSENVVSNQETNFESGFNPNPNTNGYILPYPIPLIHYNTNEFKDWENNNTLPNFVYRSVLNDIKFNINYIYQTFNSWNNTTESIALVNYYSSKERPYLKANVLYTLNLEFELKMFNPSSITTDEKLKINFYDRFAPFQLLVNGLEILSNRPSFPFSSKLKFTGDYNTDLSNTQRKNISLRLNYDFELSEPGLLEFRLLVPIYIQDLDGFDRFEGYNIKSLKIGVSDDYEFTENVRALRNINYSEILKYDTKLLSSTDISVLNNIGIGKPLFSNYFNIIDSSFGQTDFNDLQIFPPATVLELSLKTFQISKQLKNILFADGFKTSVFLEDINGNTTSFLSLYYIKTGFNSKLGYLFDFSSKAKKPKNYKKNTVIDPTTNLKYMRVVYAPESLAIRDFWTVNNSATIETFNKAISRLLHSIYSKPTYVLEGTVLQNVFPDEILDFFFDGQNRKFIPTTLELDLFEGKTKIVATEDVFELVNDITYD